MNSDNVLVLDGDSIKVVPVVRSLKRRGIKVLLAIAEGLPALAAHSRYCDEVVVHPPYRNESAFLDFLVGYLRRNPVRVLLPLDDQSILLLLKHRAAVEELTEVAMPPSDAVAAALDKSETLRIAKHLNNGISVPKTYRPHSPDEVRTMNVERFPVVIKPRTAWGSNGIRFVTTRQELADSYPEVHREYPNPLVQEFVEYEERDKFQLLYLFDRQGVLRAWYMHRFRLQGFGVRRASDGSKMRGGSGILWTSYRDDAMLDHGRELLERLGWRGFGFIEVVRDRQDGRWKLMEINPRLSGTISLPLTQGVDFAYGAYLVALGETPPTSLDFKPGARARHTLSSLVHFVRNPARWKHLGEYLDPRYKDSVFSVSDPRPFLALVVRYLSAVVRREDVSSTGMV